METNYEYAFIQLKLKELYQQWVSCQHFLVGFDATFRHLHFELLNGFNRYMYIFLLLISLPCLKTFHTNLSSTIYFINTSDFAFTTARYKNLHYISLSHSLAYSV